MIKYTFEQRSPEWYKIRLEKITGTSFKSVVAPKGDWDKQIDRLIAEDVSGQSDESDYIDDDMQRGIDLEPIAKKEYGLMHLVEVEDVGFIQSSKWGRFGVSVDGLVGAKGATEIKCPKTKTHVKYLRENILPDEHKYQTLSYFVVNEDLEWVDFISFDPRFTIEPMFIFRSTRESMAKEIEVATTRLDTFFTQFEVVKNQIVFGKNHL